MSGFEEFTACSHDEVVAANRSMYHDSHAALGHIMEPRWFGLVSVAPYGFGRRAIITLDNSADVARMIRDLREEMVGSNIDVWVEDRHRAAVLSPALAGAGATPHRKTQHLTLTTDAVLRQFASVATLSTTTDLATWCQCKLQCFSNSEDQPSDQELVNEVGAQTHQASIATLGWTRSDEDPVAIIGYYHGEHQVTFNLGTRVPYRHRHLARGLLAAWVQRELSGAARSFTINATESSLPAALYHSLGFTDETYWYEQFRLTPSSVAPTRDVQITQIPPRVTSGEQSTDLA